MATVIEVRDVSKAYKIYPRARHRLLEALTLGRRCYHTDFWALRDINFDVERGTTVGIIGVNGSGKSTLLQVVAGIVTPTTGQARVHGRVSSLLELGAGFSPEFTGRENVELFGSIMGLSRAETLARLPAVEAFAEIGEFIDRPVKSYSSGMFVRLAFAAAIHVDPDVLLVDEALAVGDGVFQHRCIRRIRELQARGTTILFVSHDIGMVKAVCQQAILLERGRIRASGNPATVANLYHAQIASVIVEPSGGDATAPSGAVAPGPVLFSPDPEFEQRAGLFRHGTGRARIRNVELRDRDGHPLRAATFNQEVKLRVHVEFVEHAELSILGYQFRDKTGTEILGTNTYEENVVLPPRHAGQTLVVEYRQRLPLAPGTYSVTTALAYDRYSPTYFDWVDNALVVDVAPPPGGKVIHSRVWLPVEITVHAG